MNLTLYFKYAIKNKLLYETEWIYSMFSKPLSDTKYLKIKDNKYFLVMNNDLVEVTLGSNNCTLDTKDKIRLSKDDLENIDSEIDTTIGIALINALLLVHPFKCKIPYQNDDIDFNKIHTKIIIPRLTNKESDTGITIKEYNAFGIALSLVRSLSELFVYSSTEKSILPPKGIIKFKQKKIKEYKNKYGEDVFKDKVKISELESELKKYDREWLKDDPGYGISISGKILNNSRKKKYLIVGSENGIVEHEDVVMIDNSLLDGHPKDKKQLASMFNNARAGSYSRGKETQISGVISDKSVRGLTGFTVTGTDCKTTKGKPLFVTKQNYISLIGRYMFVNKKSILIETLEDIEPLIGKEIILRTMLYCKNTSTSFCPMCVGKYISQNKNAITLVSLAVGAQALKGDLKKMHDSTINVYTLSLNDLIM